MVGESGRWNGVEQIDMTGPETTQAAPSPPPQEQAEARKRHERERERVKASLLAVSRDDPPTHRRWA